MNKDPKTDAAFQKIVKSLLSQVLAKIENETHESEAVLQAKQSMLEKLISLRFEFVFASWISQDPENALQNLNEIRNTPEAQDFLNRNLYFFTEVDRAFFKVMLEGEAGVVSSYI